MRASAAAAVVCCFWLATARASSETRAILPGSDALDAALGVSRSDSSPETLRSALETAAFDETLPVPTRGAALTELALALEDASPLLTASTAHPAPPTSASATQLRVPTLNRTRAVELYRAAAALGNETAQFRLATLLATGALGVALDPVRAVLHYFFAAAAGHTGAQLALGFRHSLGLGVPKDCAAAVLYYELAANAAVDAAEADGVPPLNERDRISLERRGRGLLGRAGARSEDEEVVDYYRHAAEKGDVGALAALGQIYFFGARGVERDLGLAAHFFRRAAAAGDPLAQTSLGHMLARGMHVPRDVAAAARNFSAAADAGWPAGVNGLAYMHLYGLGVKHDPARALKLFTDAADQGNAEAYYNLGALYVSGEAVRRRSYPTALNYFQLAVQKGHTLAMHKLAQMNLHGIGTARQCDNALHLFKAVAERGPLVRMLARAHASWDRDGDGDAALQTYLVAAELGYEVAQSNAAWLLDDGADILGGVREAKSGSADAAEASGAAEDGEGADGGVGESGALEEALTALGAFVEDGVAELLAALGVSTTLGVAAGGGSLDALRLYELAAEQGNVDARLRIGDYFYYGLAGRRDADDDGDAASVADDGVADDNDDDDAVVHVAGAPQSDLELAGEHYKKASDLRNPQALFNLGYMHQHGIGMDRDMHLAKRFYDMAAAAHVDARVPVSLALTGLWLHSAYRAVAFQEGLAEMPAVVRALGRWAARWRGAEPSAGAAASAAASAAAAGEAAAEESAASRDAEAPGLVADFLPDLDVLQMAHELEDDTVVAVFLFVLLAVVLIMRSREQRRRLLMQQQRQQQQAQHPHQD